MNLKKILRPKFILKLIWLAFGLGGAFILAKEYFPNFPENLQNSGLIKGVQGGLRELNSEVDYSNSSNNPISINDLKNDLKNVDPDKAREIITKIVVQEVKKVIEESTTEIKEYPQKQVRKIKIGVCEELLKEDICSVASELNCPSPSSD